MTNPEPLFVDDALLGQAEQLCTRRLANDPENRTVLASLAKLYRKQGRLTEATTLYGRFAVLDPGDAEAAYMHAVLAGTDVPVRPAGLQPAPFVLRKDFVPRSFHDSLLPFALSIQDKLVSAQVGNNEYRPEAR